MCLSVELENTLASSKHSSSADLENGFNHSVYVQLIWRTIVVLMLGYGENCIKYQIFYTLHKEFKREREN